MSSLFARSHELRLTRAVGCHRRGRGYVTWFRGVLCFGIPLFIFLNVIDYALDKGAPFRSHDLLRVLGYLFLSFVGGYLYGRLTWRNLDRAFGGQAQAAGGPGGFDEPVQ